MKEELQLARRMGIGGTDVAPILGFSPWRSAMDVWLEKKGLENEIPRDPQREFLMELGLELEPVIAKFYERETRRILIPAGHLWRHSKYGCLIGSPDRFVEGYTRGVELKTEHQYSHNFGEPGTADVPVHYALQCAHYMAVCNVDVWDIAVLHGGARFAIYTLERDREFEEALIEKLCNWWERHIIMDIPPDADSSDAWKIYLAKKFPTDSLPIIKATVQDDLLLKWFASIKQISKDLENKIHETETRLKLRIGDAAGIEGEAGRATWKKTKDVVKVNWQEAVQRFEALVPRETFADVLQKCTHTQPGVRRFLFTPSKESDERTTSSEISTKLPELATEIQTGDRPSITETPQSRANGEDRPKLIPAKP